MHLLARVLVPCDIDINSPHTAPGQVLDGACMTTETTSPSNAGKHAQFPDATAAGHAYLQALL